MRVGIEVKSNVMSYGEMARKFDPYNAETNWRTKRFGVDERTKRNGQTLPSKGDMSFADPKFDSGIYPGFDNK